MAESLRQRPLEADALTPVPLSAKRLRERGYNQAVLLASSLAECLQVELLTEGLSRSRDTPPQTGLPARERLRNLAGAMVCERPEAVAGRRVLVVDDVYTTGATMEACAAAMLGAGAERVMGLVVAREV